MKSGKRHKRSPSSRTSRTPKREAIFLQYLSETCNVKIACSRAGIARRTVYDWRDENADFAKRWDKALDIGVTVLEDEVVRRALDGVVKPVYQKGRKVGTVREFSDTLLIFALKAYRPKKYRDNIKIDANVMGGVLLMPAPAATVEEWEQQARAQAGDGT